MFKNFLSLFKPKPKVQTKADTIATKIITQLLYDLEHRSNDFYLTEKQFAGRLQRRCLIDRKTRSIYVVEKYPYSCAGLTSLVEIFFTKEQSVEILSAVEVWDNSTNQKAVENLITLSKEK